MRPFRILTAALAAVAMLGGVPLAGAATVAGSAGGGSVDLSHGWGSAKACLVWTQGGVVECFATAEELAAAESQLRAAAAPLAGGVVPNASCNSDVRLFSGASYTGLELDIWDVGYWVNLSAYGFANLTVSFINGGCQSYLAKGPNGGVAWYPNSGPWVAVANMGLYWNYTLESVYVS